jgi:5-methylcytosine-specific restriction endonuclease McrA
MASSPFQEASMENCSNLADDELLGSLKQLVKHERRNLASILGRLAEMDRRRLALRLGFHSLFDYCLRELRYSEPETALRIHAARAAAKFPVLYSMLASGRLSLTAVSMLAPHLNADNHRALIRRAMGRSKRELEVLIASLTPLPEPRDRVRHIGVQARPTAAKAASAANGASSDAGSLFEVFPDRTASELDPVDPAQSAGPAADTRAPQTERTERDQRAASEAVPEPPASRREAFAAGDGENPHACGRVHFSFTAEETLWRKMERAKELLRHKHPAARLEDILSEALEALLERIDPERRLRRKAGRKNSRPQAHGPRCWAEPVARSRNIPQWVKDAAWRRDNGRCAFLGPDGRRCGAKAGLEFDHVRPWAVGGSSDDPSNVRVLCAAHNLLEARRVFGDAAIDRATERKGRA